jgi:glyoxylase-like metal-dependent hydrolase (beta-lactamase superfamily II)
MIKKITQNIWRLSFEYFGSYVYVIKLQNNNILIDTSSSLNKEDLKKDLKKLNLSLLKINIIILTHFHYDHIENTELFKNAKIYGNKKDEKIENIDNLKISELKIIKTPGHSKESICIFYEKEKILFSGDTIFHRGTIGRTDLKGSSKTQMKKSLEKLKKIKYKILCPGHGYE